MIKEAYVSYEIAKLLKKKGFDERTLYHYTNCDVLQHNIVYNQYKNSEMLNACSAPTHQMVMAWLREKHHIHANPIRQGNYDDCSDYYTWIVASNGIIHRNQSVADKLSYEDAVEAALKYTLENLL